MTNSATPRSTLHQALRSLHAALTSANRLVPASVAVGSAISVVAILLLARLSQLYLTATVAVVLVVSIVVFVSRKSFGEAAIALVAGLLPALAVDWTLGRFVAFSVAWVLLAALTLLIASIRLAADAESIYLDAAIASARGEPLASITRQLQQIANEYSQMGPIEKAKVLRLFAYRGMDRSNMGRALREAHQLATVLRIDYEEAAAFVADVYRISGSPPIDYLDSVQEAILTSASEPDTFISALARSRYVGFAAKYTLNEFLSDIAACLKEGLTPEQVPRALENRRAGR